VRSSPSVALALACVACSVVAGCANVAPAPSPSDPAPSTMESVTHDVAITVASLEERECPEASIATYTNFAGPLVLSYCTGCHSSALTDLAARQNAPLTVDFDTMDGIRTWAPRMYLRAADGYETMPPTGGLHPEDRIRLGDWLACGMP